MRYMVPPASDATLRPSLSVLQCELREWVIWYRRNELLHWQTEYGLEETCHNAHIEIHCNLLEMELIQVHGRALWLRVYDLLARIDMSAGLAELDQKFHISFDQAFGIPFWQAIPSSRDRNRDAEEERLRRELD